MKKIIEVKNYKVVLNVNRIELATGEEGHNEHEEYLFMTKERAEKKIASYTKYYEEEEWEISKTSDGFEASYENAYTEGKAIITMQEVNLIGTVKYKVVLSEEYDFSEYPSTIEVFSSIEEAREYFNNLLEEKREDWERGSYVEIKEDTDSSFKAEAPGDKISITLEEFVEQYTPTELWEVKGTDDLEGMTFAVCTSKEKALEAEKLLKTQGFEGLGFEDLEIKKSNINLDEIKIGQDTISF